MPRAFASAQISFGLVSIPVRLFTATESSEKISFNMLHADCGSRIQQQLYCPKDERTIERTETVNDRCRCPDSRCLGDDADFVSCAARSVAPNPTQRSDEEGKPNSD